MASHTLYNVYELHTICDVDDLFQYGKWIEFVLDRILRTFPSLSPHHNRFLEYDYQTKQGTIRIEFIASNENKEMEVRENCTYIVDFLANNVGDYLPMVATSSLPSPRNEVEEVPNVVPYRPSLRVCWAEEEVVKEEIDNSPP